MMKAKVAAPFLALFLGLILGHECTAALTPARLRCEFSVNPLGIDVANPRLFWIVESLERGQLQTAYQILAASTPELLNSNNGDLWDSGRVATNATTHIRYAGKDLKSSQQVFWKLRVWDKDGTASQWSAPANWTMGINTNDVSTVPGAPGWQGRWICAPAATEALCLRKEFTVKPGLKRAIANVCGLGHYEMSLNGKKSGDDLLSPGWTDYNDTSLYDTKDVTSLLREGRNAIGITLGNGMYNVVRRNRFVKFMGSFGPLRAIGQLRLEYADGTTEFVGTDETWRTHTGPITFSSIFGGEDYDARLAMDGWDSPHYDDSAWKNAVQIVRPPGKLRGHSASADPLRVIEVLKPVNTHKLTNGEVVYDLGQNASIMPRIRVSGPVGSTIRLTPAEIVAEDGSVTQRTMGGGSRGSSWWEYIKGTTGEETWTPKFFYVGSRYIQVKLSPVQEGGDLPKMESIEGLIVHSSAEPIGDFKTSNDLLNRTRTLVRWAQRGNMVSVLTDCPHREKLGWLEQYHLNGPAIRYEFDLPRMFTKGMNDMADSQQRSGMVPSIAPEYTVFDQPFRAATEWGSAFIIVPWQQYLYDGDLDLIRQYYPAMKRYYGYLESIATNDIVSEGLGDWYDLVPGRRPGAAALTLAPVTASAFYFHNAELLSRMAALLGNAEDAKQFENHAARLRANYNKVYFNRETNNYASGSQCANAIPLYFGIAEPQNRAAVVDSLVKDLESRNHAMTAGDVGFRYLLQALAQGGKSDEIYKMINQDSQPGYGYQLKMGATSLTEAWDANRNSSHNHFMLGHITEWFYKDLVGIAPDPEGPGFEKVIIQPTPVGDLKWAEASYNSIRGKISVRWERDGSKFKLNMTIPANTTAQVLLPAKSASGVKEGGNAVERSASVKFVRHENQRAIYQVGSGSYSFDSEM
jgi:alpha-L-rhamnosidase